MTLVGTRGSGSRLGARRSALGARRSADTIKSPVFRNSSIVAWRVRIETTGCRADRARPEADRESALSGRCRVPEVGAALSNELELSRTIDLQSLGSVCTDNPQADGGRGQAAQRRVQEELLHRLEGHAEQRQCGAEDRSVVRRSALPRDPPGRSSTLRARSGRTSRQVRGLARSSRDSRRRWSGRRGRRGRAPRADADRCMPRMRAEGVHGRPARARSARTARGPRATPLPPTARRPPARRSARSRLSGTRSQRAATVSDVLEHECHSVLRSGALDDLPPSLIEHSDDLRTTNTSARAAARARAPLAGLRRRR